MRELHHIAETSKQPLVRHDYHGQLTEVTSSRLPGGDYPTGGVSARDPTAPQHARGKIFSDPVVSLYVYIVYLFLIGIFMVLLLFGLDK